MALPQRGRLGCGSAPTATVPSTAEASTTPAGGAPGSTTRRRTRRGSPLPDPSNPGSSTGPSSCCLPCGGPPPQYHGLGLLLARGLRDAAALRCSAPCGHTLAST